MNQKDHLELASSQTLVSSISLFNTLTSYPIPDEQFIFWQRIILEARPNTTPKEIKDVIIRLAIGTEIEINPKLGVQNILKHLFTEKEKQDAEFRKLEKEIEYASNRGE